MEFRQLIGKTILSIENGEEGDENIIFNTDEHSYCSYHSQSCCETVAIDRIEGNINDILNSPILEATETYDSENNPPEYHDSFTWTFQKIKTTKGEVTFVWLGESNGWYGETPYFGLSHKSIW